MKNKNAHDVVIILLLVAIWIVEFIMIYRAIILQDILLILFIVIVYLLPTLAVSWRVISDMIMHHIMVKTIKSNNKTLQECMYMLDKLPKIESDNE